MAFVRAPGVRRASRYIRPVPSDGSLTTILRRVDGWLRSPRFVLVLGLLAAAVALVSNQWIYPDYSWNRDEPVYLWQAHLLQNGQLTSSDGGFPAVLQPWLSANEDGRFFSQYPLGWPLALLVGQAIGLPVLTLVASAVLAVVGAYVLAHEITRDRRTAGLTGVLLLASPIIAIQAGVYLTYLFALGIGTLFAATFLKGVRTGSRRRIAISGALLGVIVITRTYDAVVWAGVVSVYVLATEHRRWRSLLRLIPPLIAAAVPFVVLQLGHNWYLTGHPLEFPITAKDPLDRFGFGDRRLMPALAPYGYGLWEASRATVKNAFFTPWFLAGAYLGVIVAAYGARKAPDRRATWLLLGIGVGFPIAYFPFWGTHVSSLTTRLSGPIYAIPAYVPLCILMAQGLIALARRSPRAAGAAVALIVIITVPVGVGRLGRNQELSRIQAVWSESTDDLEGKAIVVSSPSEYVLFLDPTGRNSIDLEAQDTIYAVDADASLIDLLEAHPDRDAYLQRADVPTADLAPSEDTAPYEVGLVPLELVRSDVVRVTMRVQAPRDGVVAMGTSVDGFSGWVEIDDAAVRGEWFDLTLTLGRTEGEGVDVVVPDGTVEIELIAAFGADFERARAGPDLKQRIYAAGGDELRVLDPGTLYRPDPAVTDQDEVVWRDDIPLGDVEVTVEPVPTA